MARGRQTLVQRIQLDGGEEIRKELAALGVAGEKAFAQLKAAADKSVSASAISKSIAAIRSQFAALQTAGRRFGQSFAAFTTAANNFGNAASAAARKIGLITTAITGAIAGVVLFSKRTAENSERIDNQAKSLGISVEAYQNFETAAKNAGLEGAAFDKILQKFIVNAAEAGGATSDAAKKTDDLSKSLREISVTADDGSQKLITVRGTSESLAKHIKSVGDASRTSETDLIAFAKKVTALGTAQERLNAVLAAGFDKRSAAATVTFLRALANDADDASRALSKTIAPLSQLEIAVGVNLDNAFDRLSTNLGRTKDRLFTLFAPAITQAVERFADLIFENKAAIEAWVAFIGDKAIVIVRDFFNALSGNDAAVENKWIIDFRDGVIEFGNAVKSVIFGVVIPAFKSIVAILDGVAAAINAVFGTKFTGQGLLVGAVILKMIGGFKLLGATVILTARTVGLFISGLRNIGPAARALGGILVGLVGIVRAVGAALLGLAAANPVVAAIIGLSALIAILATRQTDAERAADAHKQALAELDQAIIESQAGLPGAAERLRELGRAHLDSAKAALADAEAQVENARAALAAVPTTNIGKGQFLARIAETQNLARETAALTARKNELAAIDARLNAASQTALPDATADAAALAAEISKASEQTDFLASHVRKVPEAFQQLQVGTQLTQGLGEAENATSNLANTAQNAASAISSAFANAASSTASIWASVINGLSNQFESLVNSVSAMISRLVSELSRLRSAIASARAELSGIGDGGGDEFAGGGRVWGPGTGTSDSIPARLSAGEFVIRAAAVRKYGAALFAALNGMRFPKGGLSFNMGGLVDALVPRFAGGGMVPATAGAGNSGREFTLVIDGQSFPGLTAREDTAQRLLKLALRSQVVSNGRKPGWYGSSRS